MDSEHRHIHRFAMIPEVATRLAGSVWASTIVAGLLVGLLVGGAITGFPHGWQTFVYSAGAVLSVLMLFLLQHTTNRETKAILVKLDELIHSSDQAHNEVMGLEHQPLHHQEKVQERLHDG
jgi:low affinity Fe/Cu permease